MNILDRYLYRTVLNYTAMAMCVLLTLSGLFLFITQQGDIGVGSYSAGDAFLFTMLNLPQQAFELLPIGALIGALMGLGYLASGSELVVTRASGVSVWRVAWPVTRSRPVATSSVRKSRSRIGRPATPINWSSCRPARCSYVASEPAGQTGGSGGSGFDL